MSHSRALSGLPPALRFALRDLRGGLKGFRIFLTCLVLGVAAIAGVGSLTHAISAGLRSEGQTLLGGDLEIRTFQKEVTPAQLAYLESLGQISRNIRLRGMTRAPETGERTLTEIKAVDDLYPLYGALVLSPPISLAELGKKDGVWGAAIPPELAARLKVGVGDPLTMGNARFEVRAVLETEPDRSNEGIQWGPTILIPYAAMAETGMMDYGSLLYFHYRIRLPEGSDVEAIREDINQLYPDENWRVRDHLGSAPGIRRFVERMGMFLTLVGLTALLVGGVGVGNAVRSYLDSKRDTIATLKTLGATGEFVFRTYLIQILAVAAVAVVAGLAIGAVIPGLVTGLLPDDLPVPPVQGLYAAPLATATVYGFLITLAFAIWPLARTRDISAAQLFRSIVSGEGGWPRRRYQLVVVASGLIILLMAIGLAELKMMAAGYAVGALIALGLLRATGAGVEWGAARLPRVHRPGVRMAIANLYRPGAATGAVVLSMGLGLTLFATIALVEGNMSRQVERQIPERAPDFFMLDIQNDQIDDFKRIASGIKGLTELRTVPTLRGRITAISGVPSDQIDVDPGVRWVIEGDRNLTYSATIPKGNSIVAGKWWPEDYSGPPLISFGAEAAKGLGISVGDHVAFNILGREINAEVANLRNIDWGTLGLNYLVVFAPGTLESAPHTHLATLKLDPSSEAEAHRILTDAFPNVTAIRMKEVLATLDGFLVHIGTAVRAAALVTILGGVLVLAGALAAGHRNRVYDAVVLKILGAVRGDVLKSYLLEYLLLGSITGLIALILGAVAGWLIVGEVMDMDFELLPGAMVWTVAASILVTVFFGLFGTFAALGAKPTEVLREQ